MMSDNELIAEFNGLERKTVFGKVIYGEFAVYDYNKRWDWLMPVVEKIEHEGHEVDIYKNACEIDMEEGMIREVAENKIKATYKAVVEFIKWYNQQQS